MYCREIKDKAGAALFCTKRKKKKGGAVDTPTINRKSLCTTVTVHSWCNDLIHR